MLVMFTYIRCGRLLNLAGCCHQHLHVEIPVWLVIDHPSPNYIPDNSRPSSINASIRRLCSRVDGRMGCCCTPLGTVLFLLYRNIHQTKKHLSESDYTLFCRQRGSGSTGTMWEHQAAMREQRRDK